MLFGQNFRWGHKCGLCPLFHNFQHTQQGNDRFAGTDIALQQTQHFIRRILICRNFCKRPFLSLCQRKRQRRQHFLIQYAGSCKAPPFLLPYFLANKG